MQEKSYSRLVRGSAIYDLVVTAPFATPWTLGLTLQTLGQISPLAHFEPAHSLFANLLGSIVVVWSLLRINRPEPIFGLYDTLARALFSLWQAYYLFYFSVSPVLWGFLLLEVFWMLSQGAGYWMYYQAQRLVKPNQRL